jgi:hypothetical protein
MCKRQIDKGPIAPKPSNDNIPTPAERLMISMQTGLHSGIFSVALERTERFRLDFVAGGVLIIQGQRSRAQDSSAPH